MGFEIENGVTPRDEPRQGRLDLEEDYFVYVAVMNCDVTKKYWKNVYDDRGVDRRGVCYNERNAMSVSAIKIGCSSNPIKRVKNLGNSSPYNVNLIMHSRPLPQEAAFKLEKQLHEKFDDCKMIERGGQREWFALPAQELTTIMFIFMEELCDLNIRPLTRNVCTLPAKGVIFKGCGETITQENYGLEAFHYHPYKMFTDNYDAINWTFIAVGKETKAKYPQNKK